jgi:hypothetical protein
VVLGFISAKDTQNIPILQILATRKGSFIHANTDIRGKELKISLHLPQTNHSI